MNWQERNTMGKIALGVLLIGGTIGSFTGSPVLIFIAAVSVIVLYYVVFKSDRLD